MTAAPESPKRFYDNAVAIRDDDSACWRIMLDDKRIRTPAGNRWLVRSQALANAVADEWNTQGTCMDIRTMPMLGLTNATLDISDKIRSDHTYKLIRYAISDVICFRNEFPRELLARENAAWNPLMAWVKDQYGLTLLSSSHVLGAEQPPETEDTIKRALMTEDNFHFVAIYTMTTLLASVYIALATRHGHLDTDAALHAGLVDECWQLEKWGHDDDAAKRLEDIRAEYRDACRFLSLL